MNGGLGKLNTRFEIYNYDDRKSIQETYNNFNKFNNHFWSTKFHENKIPSMYFKICIDLISVLNHKPLGR